MANDNIPQIKSSISKIKDYDFSEEYILNELVATQEQVMEQFHKLRSSFQQLSNLQIIEKVFNVVVRDNLFNAAMQKIAKSYEFHIDEEEVQKYAEWLKANNPELKDAEMKILCAIAKRLIEKQLIFEDAAKLWGVTVSDEEVINTLKSMYAETNFPIRDIINDHNRIQSLKPMLFEQKMADEIIKHLKYKIDRQFYESLKLDLFRFFESKGIK